MNATTLLGASNWWTLKRRVWSPITIGGEKMKNTMTFANTGYSWWSTVHIRGLEAHRRVCMWRDAVSTPSTVLSTSIISALFIGLLDIGSRRRRIRRQALFFSRSLRSIVYSRVLRRITWRKGRFYSRGAEDCIKTEEHMVLWYAAVNYCSNSTASVAFS